MIHWFRPRLPVVAAAVAVLWLHSARAATAQHWPDAPVTLAGGRLLVAGDASATLGSADPGWFTYTDYETSALRRIRAGLTAEARVSRRLSFLAELRAETGLGVRPYAWYVRVTPFESRLVDIQAGRIPPVFGNYARRSYPQDNPLIGDPLGYQYLTTLRPDAVPATADDLLRVRGTGWLVQHPVGNETSHNGVPVIAANRWDTGVQVRIGRDVLEGAAAFTVGSLSHPLVRDDNHGAQIAGRLSWKPHPALALGVSGASGAFLSDVVRKARPDLPEGRHDQRALGVDVETSWGRWLLRGELIANSWRLPELDQPRIAAPLRLVTGYLEARVRLGPAVYVAARGDQLRFATIRGSGNPVTWDANVSRVELGLGYTIRRGLLVKASLLNNWRDGGDVRRDRLAAVQALFWF